MTINKMANSVDPDEIAHNDVSNLDRHCLQRYRPTENVSSDMCGQRSLDQTVRVRSDLSLHCPLTESPDATNCINAEQRPG